MIIMDESFWLAICFLIFLILFTRPLVKAISGSLTNQQQSISLALASAEEAYNHAILELERLKTLHKNLEAGVNEITHKALAQVNILIKLQEEEFLNFLTRKKQQFNHQLHNLAIKAESELLKELKTALADQLIIYFTNNPQEAVKFTKQVT